MTKRNCGNCSHYDPWSDFSRLDEPYGGCRRYPPVLDVVEGMESAHPEFWNYPSVYAHDLGCGEYQARQTE